MRVSKFQSKAWAALGRVTSICRAVKAYASKIRWFGSMEAALAPRILCFSRPMTVTLEASGVSERSTVWRARRPSTSATTETLQLSNERRDAAAKEAATLALLKELQKEQQKRNSNSLDSLASSWLEIDSGQESRQLSASPEGRDAETLRLVLGTRRLWAWRGERRSQALALPLSRSRQGSRQGRRPVLSVASLENIEEAMDEDGSFQFPSKLGADRQPLRSARMSSLAPKILEPGPG
eukprot:g27220.t1